ncbi:MAG: vWA domain-containing protein, partial [Candidatus Latescibacterota bacterium]
SSLVMFDWSEPGLRLVSGWVYPALAPALALLTFLVYRVTQPPLPRWRRLLLTGLRTGALVMLLVSLAEPVLSLRHQSVVRPTLTVLLDTSPSMEVQEAEGTRLSQVLSLVGGTEWRQALSRFEVEPRAFSQQVTPVAADTVARLRSSGRATDLGRAIQGEPGQGSPSAKSRAILLLSDGGHNLGYDPVRAAAEVGVPVFCLSVGTVAGPPDVAVVAVRVDEEAHVGQPLSVEAVVRSSGWQGVQASIRLFAEGDQVAVERLTLPADGVDLPVRLVWRPARSGPHLLRVVLESPPGEVWRDNDEARMLIRVREQRARVLVVAGSPGPELTFLLRALAADSSLTVTTRVYRGGGAFYDPAGTPASSVAGQDAVVLVDPTLDLLKGSFGEEVAARVRQGGGLLFIGGPH